VVSRWLQVSPAPIPLPVPPAARRYAATVKLTPAVMAALQSGQGAALLVGEKENDVVS
jgi:hypothetical protein